MRLQLRRWSLGALLIASCARAEIKPPAGQQFADAGDSGGTGVVPSGPPVQPGTGCGFPASPTSFTLPALPGVPPGAFKAGSGEATCAGGAQFRYVVGDMDGDQQPDLVVKSACDDATIGTDAWRVYTNTGTGFDAAAKRFALPQPRLDPSCAKTELADVDGDLAPDLVVTSLCTDAAVGTSRWIVYPNVGTGFGAPKTFALPPGAAPGAFASLGMEPASCASGRPAYAFFDLDGDRKRDLVITTACDNTQIGTTAWRVHLGSGDGVAATPILFALPATPSVPVGTYGSAAGGGPGCGSMPAGPRYSVVDFDGDFKPDIVITQDCTDTRVGSTIWSLYRNGGTGFAASPATIALPAVPGVPSLRAFEALTAQPVCSATQQAPGFTTIDVEGDFRPDLVVTRSCNDLSTGVSRWLLYHNGDGGFAPSSASFSLPAALGGSVTAPLTFASAPSCTAAPQRPDFFATYLARLKLDLVVTSVCGDLTVGTSKWLVYEAACQ